MSARAMDLFASILLVMLYCVPLVLVLFLLRWLRRRSQRRALAQQAMAVAAALDAEAADEAVAPPPQGYRVDMSGVYGSWVLFAIALGIVLLALGRWWGYIGHMLYIVLLGAVYWSALSRSAYDVEKKKCDTLDRSSYVQTVLLFFAALPTFVWLAVLCPMLLRQLGLTGRS